MRILPIIIIILNLTVIVTYTLYGIAFSVGGSGQEVLRWWWAYTDNKTITLFLSLGLLAFTAIFSLWMAIWLEIVMNKPVFSICPNLHFKIPCIPFHTTCSQFVLVLFQYIALAFGLIALKNILYQYIESVGFAMSASLLPLSAALLLLPLLIIHFLGLLSGHIILRKNIRDGR